MMPLETVGVVVAALGGAAVGLERQWSGHAEGPSARFAGIRTFTLLGIVAGLSGWLSAAGFLPAATVLLAGAVAITVAGYVAASRQDVDGTTEVAALVVLAAGVLAGTGSLRLASAIITIEVLLLVEKSRLHALVRRIDDQELRAAVRFAVMALVVLPLLPTGSSGPFGGVRPRELWLLVLFFSGLAFVGQLLGRLVGRGHGYVIGGAIGGLISSTNVTFTFARLSRAEPASARALAVGAISASAVLYPRVLAALVVLNAPLVPAVAPYLIAPALIAAAAAGLGARGALTPESCVDTEQPTASRNSLQLLAALQMATLFQLVIFLVNTAREVFGDAGVLTTAAVLGLTDVDALTLSMAREVARNAAVDTAALAIAIGILANTALKTGIALVFGSRRFRLIAGGTLALVGVSAVVSIALVR
jgi:uncharacterized membrane protein (DUF4010 family)